MAAKRQGEVDVRRLLHDLNNDLGLVLGHAELALLAAGRTGDAPMTEKLEKIREAARRMADRVRDAQSGKSS